MSRLTRSEIETMFDDLILAHPIYTPQLRALRDQSLSQEAVREDVLVALEEAVDYALDVWMDRQFPYEQRTYVDGTFVEAMTELGKQRTALKREPNAQERIYTKADMEAACELALAGYRSKPVLDKMVDRFLAWPLPDSVCADLIATRQGPGRIGTNLLSATEARQMLEHVLKHEPNVAGPEDKGKVK